MYIYTKKLEAHGMYTMGDVARRSIQDEEDGATARERNSSIGGHKA